VPLYSTLQHAALVIDWIPVLSFFWLSRTRQTRICRIIFIFIFTTAIFRWLGHFVFNDQDIYYPWNWVIMSYSFALINYMYFHHSLLKPRYIMISLILFLSGIIWEASNYYPFLSALNISYVIISCFAMRHIVFKVIGSDERLNDYTFDMVNYAMLFYFTTGSMLQFILDQLHSPHELILALQDVSSIVFKLIITYALWKLPSKSQSYPL
jgi:hypothetical protein